jgi:hypothetical protein
MLYITFGDKTALDDYRIFNYDNYAEWLQDPFVQEMIEDVDKSKVINGNLIDSPFLGNISPTQLSGGVKLLIILYEYGEVIDATCCGDNCAKWIIEMSKKERYNN